MVSVPVKLNQAGRHRIPRQKHTVTNWPAYDASLRQRGSLTVWFSDEAIAAWAAEPRTTRGGQPWYSALAILTALTLRAVFRLALRQTEELIGSVIHLLGLDLPVPDHTTLSRRAETLEVPRPRSSSPDGGSSSGRRVHQRQRAPSRSGGHCAAARNSRAEPDGRERADPAGPPPPAHRRAGPHGVAASLRVHETGSGRDRDQPVQARDRG